jgi:hypothetical protein
MSQEPTSQPPPSPATCDPQIVSLAVEHWRLSGALESAHGPAIAAARYAARRMADILRGWQIEARSLDGMRFDPGMAAKVVDLVEDPSRPAGEAIIEQTIAPLVIWRGQVVRPAEVVVRQSKGK